MQRHPLLSALLLSFFASVAEANFHALSSGRAGAGLRLRGGDAAVVAGPAGERKGCLGAGAREAFDTVMKRR